MRALCLEEQEAWKCLSAVVPLGSPRSPPILMPWAGTHRGLVIPLPVQAEGLGLDTEKDRQQEGSVDKTDREETRDLARLSCYPEGTGG